MIVIKYMEKCPVILDHIRISCGDIPGDTKEDCIIYQIASCISIIELQEVKEILEDHEECVFFKETMELIERRLTDSFPQI
jgi:hypothetical protein